MLAARSFFFLGSTATYDVWSLCNVKEDVKMVRRCILTSQMQSNNKQWNAIRNVPCYSGNFGSF